MIEKHLSFQDKRAPKFTEAEDPVPLSKSPKIQVDMSDDEMQAIDFPIKVATVCSPRHFTPPFVNLGDLVYDPIDKHYAVVN